MPFIVTTALKKISQLNKRIWALPGGSSAGKTIGAIEILIDKAQTDKKPTITSIVSESMPHIKRGAERDFKNIMNEQNYWRDQLWNATDHIYTFETGSIIEFFGADQSEKVKGPRRDRLFINEANNVPFNTFTQLEIRTNELIILDWNPSIEFWYYTEVKGKMDNVDEITLTYKDNEGLNPAIAASIEARRHNKAWFKVYGEGKLGEIEGKIFKDWQIIDEIPHEAQLERTGLDFGYCVDNQTEILTKRGWKAYNEIEKTDEALTLNPKTKLSEWQKIQKVNVFQGKYEMWSLEKLGHSSFSTSNHRWLIENHGKYSFKTTEKLKLGDNIPAARDCSTLPSIQIYSDAFVELVAWFWTEGQITQGGISIWQNEGGKAERIRKCLKLLYGETLTKTRNGRNRAPDGWIERPKRKKLCHFAINLNGSNNLLEVAPNKVVSPRFISCLTSEQLTLFLEISIAADGSTTRNGTRIITQSSVERLNPIQMACALRGIRTTLQNYKSRSKFSYGNDVFSLTLFKARKNIYIGESKKSRYLFQGAVWCPTVKNGTWLARRKGTTYFTGNTNDPTAIVDIYYYNGGYIWDEVVYQWGMSNKNIADLLKTKERKALVIADSAEPKSIDEIKGYAVAILGVSKKRGESKSDTFVKWSIGYVQNQRNSITKRSVNIIKEYRNYIWLVDKNGVVLNEEDTQCANHAMRAGAYAMVSLKPQETEIQTIQNQQWQRNEVMRDRNSTR